MDRFILAEHPFWPERSGLFINHMLDPIAIISCSEGHIEKGPIFRHYQFRNKKGAIEEWTLSIFSFFTTDFLETPEDRALKLLDRAWRWYRAYMEEEDANSEEEDHGQQN